MDALSRWVPADGADSVSFTEGSYRVQKGEQSLRRTRALLRSSR